MATEGYSLREVGKLLGMPRSILCGLIDAGFVSPTRGRRREYRFSFHDLVLLRAAQGLSAAKLPSARILRSLRRLRAQLPETVPLSGLRIEAVGDSVVVVEADTQWQSDNGQYVFRFQVETPEGRLAFIDAASTRPELSDSQWFAKGWESEKSNPDEACQAYRRAIELNEHHLAAYANLGRLLHQQGNLQAAEKVYRDGLARCGPDGIVLFNLAVLMEDLQRNDEATDAYRAALEEAPDLADAHYNLALLCESRGLRQESLRHMSAFRKLGGS